MRRKLTLNSITFHIVIALFLVIQVYPMVWLIISSFRPNIDLSNRPFGFPTTWVLDNYVNVMTKSNIFLYLRNTMIVAAVSLTIIVILSSLASYAISILKFKYSNKVYAFFIAGLTIPYMVTVIPLFTMFTSVGIIDSLPALIIPMVAFSLPVSILLFVNFYKFIPGELVEAAIIDGCNVFQIYSKVIFPLSLNTVVTVIAMNLIFVWNDYTFPLIFINSTEWKTISLGLQDFIGSHGVTDWGATFAAICIATLPTLILYFILHKKIVGGITLGSVKS